VILSSSSGDRIISCFSILCGIRVTSDSLLLGFLGNSNIFCPNESRSLFFISTIFVTGESWAANFSSSTDIHQFFFSFSSFIFFDKKRLKKDLSSVVIAASNFRKSLLVI
jgi:hypothetical protein